MLEFVCAFLCKYVKLLLFQQVALVFIKNLDCLCCSLFLAIIISSLCVDLLTSDALNQLQLDCQDGNRNTALHLACLQGHEESALAILEKCSDAVTQMSNASNKTYVVGCCQYVGHTASLENCDWCGVFMNSFFFLAFSFLL